jgi:hypothetical protein
MAGNQEGIGVLKLQCPQAHPVGRILREAPHHPVMYDPGAVVGPRRFWPDEDEQPRFTAHCRVCNKPVGEVTATLQSQLSTLIADMTQSVGTAMLSYL